MRGPFADFEGIVENVNEVEDKVRVCITFMGRETPMELDFFQVKRLLR